MFKKILSFLNVPGHIKRWIYKTKLKKSREEKKNDDILIQVINIMIVVIILAGLVYVNFLYAARIILVPILSILALITFFTVSWIKRKKRVEVYGNKVTKLVLKDDDGRITREWDIGNRTSCLIGKKTRTNEVDIDLSDAVYSSLISRQHAVLNNVGNTWYFEDIGSSNGSGIKRKGENRKFKVESGKPYEVKTGDILYIANTRLYLR